VALSATVVPDPAAGLFFVLTAAGGTAPYRWQAFPNGGDAYTVPATVSDPTGRVTLDGFAPFGREVTYRVTDSTGDDVEVQATLPDPPSAVLSDAADPNRAEFVTVLDQLPNTWAARSVWFDVLDRRDPFVAAAPMRYRDGTIVLRVTGGTDDRRALLGMLTPGTPLVLRSPCHEAVDDVVILVTEVTEELSLESAKTGPRAWRLTYQAVTRDIGPYLPDPTWTWADLVADPRNPSWAAVVAGYATWADVTADVRGP
jgi:hypothetical protein